MPPKCSFIIFICLYIAVFETWRGLYFVLTWRYSCASQKSIKLSVNQSEAHFYTFQSRFQHDFSLTSFTGIWTCAHQCEFSVFLWLEDTSVLRIVFSFGLFSHGLEQYFSILALNINDLEMWNFSGEIIRIEQFFADSVFIPKAW